jgi:hypothetical protein
MASLSLGHMAAMPDPDDATRLSRGMLQLRRDAGRTFYVHVIYAGCSCTERLFRHLVERGPHRGIEEMVLFIGEDADKRRAAEQAGFRFATDSAEHLARGYGIEAAPLLVAFDAGGRMRYLGGYYNHPSTVFPLDEKIHEELARGEGPKPLPIFGCAMSARLQKSVDPLGIVYRGG